MKTPYFSMLLSFAVFALLNGCIQNIDTTSRTSTVGTYAEENKFIDQTIMTVQERSNLRKTMLSMKSFDECTNYTARHDQIITARTEESGSSSPLNRSEICHRMKSAGMFR